MEKKKNPNFKLGENNIKKAIFVTWNLEHFPSHSILRSVFPRQNSVLSEAIRKRVVQCLIPAVLPTAPSPDLSQHWFQLKWLLRTDRPGQSSWRSRSLPLSIRARAHTHRFKQFWEASTKQHAFSSAAFLKRSTPPPSPPASQPRKLSFGHESIVEISYCLHERENHRRTYAFAPPRKETELLAWQSCELNLLHSKLLAICLCPTSYEFGIWKR